MLDVVRNVMIIFTIILAIIIVLILYVKFLSYIDDQRYQTKFQVVFNAHKEIGYPPLTKEQQFDILDYDKMAPVLRLTKHNIVPTGLLNHYIKIKPSEYFEHLKAKNLKEEMRFEGIRDGFFIKETKRGFEYLFIERNSISFKKKFSTYDKLLNYLVYDRLSLYAPKNYKFAWLKKHFA